MQPSHSEFPNPYTDYVHSLAEQLRAATTLPLGGLPPVTSPAIPPDAPTILLFSPHPDDECITGLLPLRLQREAKLRIVNVPVTYGSSTDRRAERHQELLGACAYLGWNLLQRFQNGTQEMTDCKANSSMSSKETVSFESMDVAAVVDVLDQVRPAALFVPHADDWNIRHTQTHQLVMTALQDMPSDFECGVIETEFWHPMSNPNVMIEGDVASVADLVAATSFHIKEVERNPFHRLLPAWMMDNVRRGSELIGGRGQRAPAYDFATLYRASRWRDGSLKLCQPNRLFLPISRQLTLADLC